MDEVSPLMNDNASSTSQLGKKYVFLTALIYKFMILTLFKDT